MAKDKQIFREKSLERINSPESLNDYLKVSSPGVLVTLLAIIVILCGVLIWGYFGRIDVSEDLAVVSDGENTICLVQENALEAAFGNREITINDKNYKLAPDALSPITITEDTNAYVKKAGDLKVGDVVYKVPLEVCLDKGVYVGTIIIETIRPISFLLN